jgi:hypothetical protein
VTSESMAIRFPSGAWEYVVTERVPETTISGSVWIGFWLGSRRPWGLLRSTH